MGRRRFIPQVSLYLGTILAEQNTILTCMQYLHDMLPALMQAANRNSNKIIKTKTTLHAERMITSVISSACKVDVCKVGK